MLRLFKSLGLFFFFLFSFSKFALAEDISITTYYPSPYGSYRELRSARMAIGDNYIDPVAFTWEVTDGDGGEVDFQADLVVQGNVGMGTANPQGPLQVQLPAWTNRDNDSQHVILSNATDLNAGLRFGFSRASMLGSVNVLNPGVAWGNLILQDGGGSVGIGTTTPGAYKLNVNGDAYVGGANGVTATKFRDLDPTYFLDSDPGSNTGFSANIRGNMILGGNPFNNSTKLDITGSGGNPSWCIYMRNSTVGMQIEDVNTGIYVTAADTGINAVGNTWYGVSGTGAYAGVYAGSSSGFGIWAEGPSKLSGYFRRGAVVIDPAGATIPNSVSTTYGLDVRGSVKANSYVSADGSVGITQDITAGGCTLRVKNGLVMGFSCP